MYDWTRFWCLSTESFSLADDGFLYDPQSEYGATLNPAARVPADVTDDRFLVLLGEPGIGKSTAIQQQVAEVQKTLAESGDKLLSLDLGEYGDESRLIADLFQSPAFRDWKEGDHKLHLFLDSVDECRLQIPHVAKVIANGLERHREQLDRMRLRISCRTADWPALLTERFAQLWGETAPAILELLPLRQRDVALAASENGLDGDEFVNQVIRNGAQPFAIKPISLQFLLQVFKEHGALPATQVDLYQQGCRLLCEEKNLDRQSAGQIGQFSSSERIATAERIAAVIVLCNKVALDFAPSIAGRAPDDISISELVEALTNANVPTSEALVRETLGSGLFSGHGLNRLGFAHRTFAEFLAASYLHHSKLATNERLKFIQHAEDPNNRIVPQLRETAAWLASLDQAVFRAISESDPQVLIRSDAASHTDEDRRQLVDRLLSLAQLDQLDASDWTERNHYHKLSHNTIAEQLAPLVVDRQKPLEVRRLAIDVIETCCAESLQDKLVEIALDDTEEHEIRFCAANAIGWAGGKDAQLRLKPLALSIGTSHSELELKSVALRPLWPDHITGAELFGALPVPTNDRYGSYGFFLTNRLPKSLKDEDLPHALRWAGELSVNEAREFSIRDLVAAIARRAWDRLDRPAVFNAFVDFALQRLINHEDLIPKIDNDFVADETMRRSLAESIVPRISDFDRQGFGLIFERPRHIRESDVSWMLGKLRQEANSSVAGYWAKLIGRLFDPTVPGQLDEVFAALEFSREFREEFEPRFAAIPLNSPAAQSLRERYNQILEWEREENDLKNLPPLDPPPIERIENALQACEHGNADAWFYASRDLQLEVNSRHFQHDLEIDLTTLPGWYAIDDSIKSRLLNGARQFLIESEAGGNEWLGTNSTPLHALWGYKALLLLRKEARHLFDSLPPEVWTTWTPIVINFYDYAAEQKDKELHDEIARVCAEKASDAVRECLRLICERFEGQERTFILPQFAERSWTDSLKKTLCDVAENPKVKPAVVAPVLDALLTRKSMRGREIAIALVYADPNGESTAAEKRIAAAIALLRHTEDAGWSVVWPRMQYDRQFGQTVFRKVAYQDMHNPSVAEKIPESSVAELYIWLERQFPRAEDPQHNGAHFVSERDAIKSYRDGTLGVLANRATPAAIEALSRIEQELPHLDWIHRVVTSAKATMLRKTWRPLTPADLFGATQHANSRLVRGARDLQEVVLESLESLQLSLQGETPAAPDLWDEVVKGKFRPKDENHLSDYIKRHLERDLRGRGIVSLREVEIRRGEGSETGERTDIHVTGQVEGIVSGTLDQVRVIIEVKGSWHAQSDTAMKSQLTDRYLKDNDCRNGIYIVGWYRCDQWDATDGRLTASRNETVDELFYRMTAQADSLCGDDITIRAFALNAALR